MKIRNRHSGVLNAMKAYIIKNGNPWKDSRDRVYAQLSTKQGLKYGPIVRVVK